MDKKAFFDYLRRPNSGVFGNTLSQVQVDSMNAILDNANGFPLSWLAYAMGTAYGETGMDYAKTEYMSYTAGRLSEMAAGNKRWRERLNGRFGEFARQPEKLANLVYHSILGNGGPNSGDGWKYRGHGLPQVTGKDNFAKVRRLTGLEVVANPSLLLSPVPSARALLAAFEAGIYTGKKAADYLPRDGKATRQQMRDARRIINGTFEADKFAGYGLAFQEALAVAGYEPKQRPVPAPRPTPTATPSAPSPSWVDFILRLLRIGK